MRPRAVDRKSTRLNSSHDQISYAVFCLKKKKKACWRAPGRKKKENDRRASRPLCVSLRPRSRRVFCPACRRRWCRRWWFCFFFNDTATTEIYTLSLHDALPISGVSASGVGASASSTDAPASNASSPRSEEHTSELQSRSDLVCRLLLEKKKKKRKQTKGKKKKRNRHKKQ